MSYSETDRLWWEEIPGPRGILNEITRTLKDSRSVILNRCNVPWIKRLRYIVSRAMEEQHIITSEIDASTQGTDDPGKFLLGQMGRREDINDFRDGMGITIFKHFKDRGVLQSKLVCILNIEESRQQEWAEFITRYKSKDMHDGIFFLEVNNPDGRNFSLPVSPRILKIDMRSTISIYDVLSFTMLMASSLPVHDMWKQYIAWLSTIIFEKDVESMADYLGNRLQNLSQAEILVTLESLVEDREFLNHAAWRAQMHIFFPVIEQIRISLIEKNKDAIKSALDQHEIIYFDNRITEPYDAELGPLAHMVGRDWLRIAGQECAEILLLHDCRNNLAHVTPCKLAHMERIIDIAQRMRTDAAAESTTSS
jgi:hypothetical protein